MNVEITRIEVDEDKQVGFGFNVKDGEVAIGVQESEGHEIHYVVSLAKFERLLREAMLGWDEYVEKGIRLWLDPPIEEHEGEK